MIDTNGTTWTHANVIIGGHLRRVVVGTAGPGNTLAASFPTDTNGECAITSKIHHFTATTWEEAVATAEALA